MSDTKTFSPKAYPKYKNTEIPELGEIPDHWELIRLRNMGSFSKGSGGTKEDEVDHGLPCIRYGDLYTYHKYFITESRSFITPQKAEEYTPIEKGDILFTTSDVTIRNVGKSAVNLMDSPVYCGPDLIILRPTKLHHHFAGYLLDSPYAQAQKARMQRGVTIMHIYTSQLGDIPFGVPPPDEQAAIVRYLDDVEQRIRAYVSVKERLIALLEEERQAVIHQAVTRGLDPNVKLKPSGVEWLGDVPEHWEIQQLKQKSRIFRGRFSHRPRNDASLYDGPYPFIQTGDIARAGKWITTYEQTLNDRGLAVSQMFPRGTLVMTIAANIGDAAILDLDACFPDSVVGFTPSHNVDRDYLYNLFQSMKTEFLRVAPVNTQGNLNVDRIGATIVAFPPLAEQTTIAAHLNQLAYGSDTAIDRARRQIELMEEYRTRLIADVVTGKIDVREKHIQTNYGTNHSA